MNLIKKQSPFFPSLIDDFINADWNFSSPSYSATIPAVNIKELDTQYEIELAVPGLQKDHFEIEVERGILSISASKSEEDQINENGKFTRREFSYNGFRRSFTLPDSVDPAIIKAQYQEGVLQVILPKKKEAQPQPKKLIEIR